MSGFALRLRSQWHPPEWPRFREGASKDERAWIDSLSDRELARLCASLGQIDRAVRDFRKPEPADVVQLLRDAETER